jgi:hypothetical protein
VIKVLRDIDAVAMLLALVALALVLALPGFLTNGQPPQVSMEGRMGYSEGQISGLVPRVVTLESAVIELDKGRAKMEADILHLQQSADRLNSLMWSILTAVAAIAAKNLYDVIVDVQSKREKNA